MAEFSKLISGIAPSATNVVSDKARDLKRAGVDVIDLGGGDPDFNTPQHIVEAALEAMKSGQTHYVSARGIPELREAIARKLATENGVKVDPATEVVVTPGGKMAIYAALQSLVNPGDEVLCLEPAWVSYSPIIELVGGRPVSVGLDPKDNYQVREDDLKRHISPRTKAIIVNSPNNPTGRVLSMAEWRAIANVADRNDLYVISDEIYEKLLFDNHRHISAGSLPELRQRTITVNGFSKTYAMTGWRLGYVAGDKKLMSLIVKVQQQTVTCAPSFAQFAALAALNGPQDVVEQMRRVYEARRDILVEELNRIPGVECPKPEGAFYVFVRFPGVDLPSVKLAEALLDRVAVATTPGIAFGQAGEGFLRMTFATSTEGLRAAPARIAEALRQLA